MPRFYCPHCWHELETDVSVCPACGEEIRQSWEAKDFVEKLIAALDHPEPTTPIRAALFLGKIGDERAVGPLMALAGSSDDVYIVQAAARALGAFATPEAKAFLRSLLNHPAVVVRAEAEKYSG